MSDGQKAATNDRLVPVIVDLHGSGPVAAAAVTFRSFFLLIASFVFLLNLMPIWGQQAKPVMNSPALY
jgi:hypothetical protein